MTNSVVVTSGPITADAATAKVVGIKKSITVSASATNKVTGLSKAEKKIVKVTKKGKKFTIKGLKAGKATFKIGKKSYTVKVGATTVKAAKTKLTLTKGKAATLKFTTKSGNGDTLTFKASNKNVTLAKKSAKIAKSAASVKATAKKAGKTTITATSKATGKKATVTVTVKNAAKPATTTPGASNTPVATATGSATNTPEATATATATATASGSATNTPDVTATPVATATGTATATPVATGSATNTPEATEVPTEAPTKAPEVVTGGTITVTTNVTGASIKVISGTAVIAEEKTVTTGAAIKDIVAGTYVVSVSKDGYDTETATVVVTAGKTADVNVTLKTATLKIASVKAVTALDGSKGDLEGATTVVGDKDRGIQVTFATAVEEKTVNVNNFKIVKDGINQPLSAVTLSTDKKTVTITPVNNLKDDSAYTLVVSAKVQEQGTTTVLGKEASYNFKTGTYVYALTGATNTYVNIAGGKTLSKTAAVSLGTNTVAKDSTIKVKYNQTVDPSTISTSTVKLYNVTDGKYVGVTATALTNEVTVTLAEDLVANKQYRLEIKGLKALLGVDVMEENFTFVTNTASSVASLLGPNGSATLGVDTSTGNNNGAFVYPKLSAGTIDNGSDIFFGAKLYVSFSGTQDIDASTINKDTVTLVKYDKENDKVLATVDVDLSYDANTRRATVVPKADLEDGTVYRLQVKGVKDVFGLEVENGSGKTTTSAIFTTYDATAPTITGVEMKQGATGTFKSVESGVTGVDETKGTIYIKVKFSEAVSGIISDASPTTTSIETRANKTAFTSNTQGKNVMLIDAATGKTVANLSGQFTTSTDGKELTFATSADLANNTTYTLMIAGKNGKPSGSTSTAKVTDTAVNGQSNELVDTYSFTFSTNAKDVTAPTIEGVKYGSSYKDGKDLNGLTNVYSGKDAVYVQFSEKIALAGNPIELGLADGSDSYTQSFAAYGNPAGVLTSTTSITDFVINVTNGQGINSGDIIKVTDGTTTAYAIVKSKATNAITLVSPIGAAINTENSSVTKLAAVTVSDADTDAKTLKIDLATAKNGTSVDADKKLKLTVKNTVKDVAGNELTAASYTFLTGSDDGADEKVSAVNVSKETSDTSYDETLPVTGIRKGTNIKVVFGEQYAPSTVDASTVKLTKADGTAVAYTIDATNNASGAGNAYVILDPTDDLEAGAEYTVTVNGVKDTAGNAIAKYSKSFVVATTASFKSCNITDGQTGVDVTPVIEVSLDNLSQTQQLALTSGVTLKKGTDVVYTRTVVSNNTIKLYPCQPLASYSEYKIVIDKTSTGVDKTINFTTEAKTETANVESATYDSETKTITVQFNVPVKGDINGSGKVIDAITANSGDLGTDASAAVRTDDPTKLVIALGSKASIIKGATQLTLITKASADSDSATIAAYAGSSNNTDLAAMNNNSTVVVVK